MKRSERSDPTTDGESFCFGFGCDGLCVVCVLCVFLSVFVCVCVCIVWVLCVFVFVCVFFDVWSDGG